MRDNVEVNWLLDYYGGLLTAKQIDVLQMHYSDDLSLSEIAQELDITRQAVHDSIRRGQAQLVAFEEKLGLVARHFDIARRIESIHTRASSIVTDDAQVHELTEDIETLLQELDY